METILRRLEFMDGFAINLLDPEWTQEELHEFFRQGGQGIGLHDHSSYELLGFVLYVPRPGHLEVQAITTKGLDQTALLLDEVTNQLSPRCPRAKLTLSEYEDDLRSLLVALSWEAIDYSDRGRKVTFAGYAPVPLEAATDPHTVLSQE